MTVGIDAIRFYSPPFAIKLETIALRRGVDPNKFHVGLGQETMSVLPPDEDIVTMAAHAALPLLDDSTKQAVHLVLFATESGVDQSKAAGLWVHHLLGLPRSCRVVELKQACYSATCALQLATAYLLQNPAEKVLLLASDNARYGLNTPGEPTQGCGAAAMILSVNPRVLAIEPHRGVSAEHSMDFWRPNYMSEAVVDGKYSTKSYLNTLSHCWKEYSESSGRTFTDHHHFCYHIPFTRMAEKAHERLAKTAHPSIGQDCSHEQLASTLLYSRQLGNTYTAALYVGLSSLLENSAEDLSGHRVGLFSYGSGCVGEFFSGVIQPGYRSRLFCQEHQAVLNGRRLLSYEEYEDFFNRKLPEDGTTFSNEVWSPAAQFRLSGVANHERLYTAPVFSSPAPPHSEQTVR